MRNARIAEWILAQMFPADRAAAIAGDLLEDAASRGSGWFWRSVAETVFRSAWRELLACRGQLAAIVGGSFFLLVFLTLVASLLPPLLWSVLLLLRNHTGVELIYSSYILPSTAPEAFARAVIGLWVQMLVPFQIGRWAARRAVGRERLTWAVMIVGWSILAAWTKSPMETLPVACFSFMGVLYQRWQSRKLKLAA